MRHTSPEPYACQRMMHAHSGNLSDRCSFSRSTTLPAELPLKKVGNRVISAQNHGFHAVGPSAAPLGDTSTQWSSLENVHIGVTFRDLQLC